MSSETNDDGCKTYQISIKADRKYSGDALRSILSTILFLRLFGSLAPSTGESVGVTYPKIENQEIETLLTSKVRELAQKFSETGSKSLDVSLDFYERRVKKTAWFAKTHSFCWESWKVQINLNTAESAAKSIPLGNYNSDVSTEAVTRKQASQELRRALMEIVSNADNHKEHIPPITTTDVAPFPYKISIV